MSFKLLSIGSMYPGSLDSFYRENTDIGGLSYNEHLSLLLDNTTEFTGAYVRNFRKIGIEADCIVVNDEHLLRKLSMENKTGSGNLRETLLKQVRNIKPDVLWIEDLNYTDSSWLNLVRNEVRTIKLIIAYHCSPFNKKVLENMSAADFLITCTPGLKDDIEKLGKKAHLVYHGFDNKVLSKYNVENTAISEDLIFSGSLISGGDFHGNRIKLIESLIKAGLPLSLYVNLESNYRIRAKQAIYLTSRLLKSLKLGSVVESNRIFSYGKTWVNTYSRNLLEQKKPPVFGAGMYNLFSRSKIVLNYHIGVAGEYAGNMRMFEVTGAGSCLLTDHKKNIKDLFEPGSEVVTYENAEDCIEKAKWLLEHEEERRKIASAGNKKTLDCHTVENRCRLISEIINSELRKF